MSANKKVLMVRSGQIVVELFRCNSPISRKMLLARAALKAKRSGTSYFAIKHNMQWCVYRCWGTGVNYQKLITKLKAFDTQAAAGVWMLFKHQRATD